MLIEKNAFAQVFDRPGPPQGPLDVSEVSAEAMTLSWRAPKDDGGSDITNYIVEKREQGAGEWQPVTKSILSTNFRVRNLDKGRNYEFRVMAENQYGVSDPLCITEAVTAKNAVGRLRIFFKLFCLILGDISFI